MGVVISTGAVLTGGGAVVETGEGVGVTGGEPDVQPQTMARVSNRRHTRTNWRRIFRSMNTLCSLYIWCQGPGKGAQVPGCHGPEREPTLSPRRFLGIRGALVPSPVDGYTPGASTHRDRLPIRLKASIMGSRMSERLAFR